MRAFAKKIVFWTSPFIVVPNVRLKLPSELKKVDMTFSRSARTGSVRKSAKPAWSSFTVFPSLRVMLGYGKSALAKMP